MEQREYRTPLVAEMERRKALIEVLPGARLKADLDAMNRCSYIIGANGKELADHVGQFVSSRQHVNDVSDTYVNELVRLLHNYLASVTSLIDAQRVVMRHRWPSKNKDEKSEFERKDYADQLRATFATGEAEFMVKLRNYCTHYSVPLPALGTTIKWENGGPVIHVNTLQLDRDKLLRWDSWGAAAKAYLERQDAHFDLAPIIESYMKSVRKFYEWFWTEIDTRSEAQKDELRARATELQLWHDENNVRPDWLTAGQEQPANWNRVGRRVMRHLRAQKRIERYAHGTRGFSVSTVNSDGEIVFIRDDWSPLPN
ncbi:hypothetical protein [Nocardia sp. NPDC004860]|uniref:hypothetical protein n=1 Tax=Nocardia sp. NPDC004860 TaxID=3154557 RepID=UPI0033BEBD17